MAPRAIDSGPQSLRKGLPAVFNSLIVDGAQTCRCVQRECMKGITWRLSRVIAIAAERFHPRWLTDSFHVRNETDGQGQTGGDRPSWFGQRRKLAVAKETDEAAPFQDGISQSKQSTHQIWSEFTCSAAGSQGSGRFCSPPPEADVSSLRSARSGRPRAVSAAGTSQETGKEMILIFANSSFD